MSLDILPWLFFASLFFLGLAGYLNKLANRPGLRPLIPRADNLFRVAGIIGNLGTLALAALAFFWLDFIVAAVVVGASVLACFGAEKLLPHGPRPGLAMLSAALGIALGGLVLVA
jgi:hypothetical protein